MNMFNDKSQLLSCSKRSKNNSLLTQRHSTLGSLDTLTNQKLKTLKKQPIVILQEDRSLMELLIFTTTSFIHTTMLSATRID